MTDTTTRRQFITNLATAAPLAAGALLAGPMCLESGHISAIADPHPIPQVNDWLTKLAASLEPITAFQAAVATARRHTINIPEMVNLHLEAFAAAEKVDDTLERADKVLERLAGQEISYGDYLSDDYIVPPPPMPYGPPERTEIIDKWIGRLDKVLTTLESYYGFLIEARSLPPGKVDGVKLVNLENEVHALCDHLVGCIDCDYVNNLITAATGRSSGAVCVETELRSDSHNFDRPFWQREVEAVSEDHPEERARLQALLDARYGGVL